jgi:hypothetical protein
MSDLREFLKLKYLGNCKCGECQLVPAAEIERHAASHEALLEALREAHRALSHYEWYARSESGWGRPDNITLRGAIESAIKAAEASA